MKNLVFYLTINYPTEKEFFEVLDIFESMKIGYVEIGIPSINPFMDGSIVQKSQKQIIKSITSKDILITLEKIKKKYSFKIVIMTYYDGINNYRLDEIPQYLYDSILCVDRLLPDKNYPSLVHIFSSELPNDEIKTLLNDKCLFAYVTSGKGKTGEFKSLPNEYVDIVQYLKTITSIPIFVGFGVKTKKDIKNIIKNGADGAIIGSELIRQLDKEGVSGVQNYLSSLS